jgi:hypothetical protein
LVSWAEQIATEVARADQRPRRGLAQTGGSPCGEPGLAEKMVSGERIRAGVPYYQALTAREQRCLFPVEGSGSSMIVCAAAVNLMTSDVYCESCLRIVGYKPVSKLARSVLNLSSKEARQTTERDDTDHRVLDLVGARIA